MLLHDVSTSADHAAFTDAVLFPCHPQVESKFKPTVSHSLSVENFDKIWTDLRPEDSPCGTPTDPALAHSAFEGFTYIAPSFLPEAMAQLSMQAAAAKEHGA